MKISFEKVSFPMRVPFVITGYTFTATDTVRVTLEKDGVQGHGEGVGVYYLGDTADVMLDLLDYAKPDVEQGLSHEDVQKLLPPGGARNALDCAYWDLEAKLSGISVWDRLKLKPKGLKTVYTIGIGSADEMAKCAADYGTYNKLKIKLDGKDPILKLEAIRAVRPDASLIIDVNQGWTLEELKEYAPHCASLGIEMIEQPLKRGADEELAGYRAPLPIGADESCLHADEFDAVADYYDVINIKLDKCGGLTAGLELAKMALKHGKRLMVGNMSGSSLSMAPAYVIGQFCDFIDIDGPLVLARDVENPLFYSTSGVVEVPSGALWG
ncbi:dipeptide epimerase [Kordiimonas marina]|uniref:dipeptide epimerase n=1 Tax=Kordiimonas marina TaxID=2872312 RepID=UPI001FF3FCD2|nr:dipeptide epimerase [Kordiimonas marina]MCJ9427974.1 dipeptide epimerase [Kordiimonas marina]